MPTIPIGNAGFAVPRAAPAQPAGVGPGLGAGLAELGQAGMASAADALAGERAAQRDDVNAQRQQAAEIERERRAIARQQETEARQAAAESKRLAATTAAVTYEIDAEDARAALDARLRAKEITPDQYDMELTTALGEARDRVRQTVDPEYHQALEQAFIRPTRKAMLEGRATVTGVVKDEALAQLDGAREALGRLAVTDPSGAIKRAAKLFDEQYQPIVGDKEAGKLKQAFTERAWRDHYTRAVADASNDPRRLAALRGAVSGQGALDPAQQTALLASIDTKVQTLQSRSDAAADRALRRQEQTWRAAEATMAAGLPLDPQYASQTAAALKGSPYERAFVDMVQGSADTARFGSLPVQQQDQVLMGLYAERKAGTNPTVEARIQRFERIRDAARTGYAQNPWEEAARRGQIDAVPPIQLGSLEQLAGSLAARMEQAPVIDRLTGRPTSPLQPEEARALGDFLERLPVPERVKALGELGKQIGGRRLEALSVQLGSKNDQLAIAAFLEARGTRTASGRSNAELFLAGEQVLAEKSSDRFNESEVTGVRQQIAEQIGDAFTSPQARAAAIRTATAYWAAQKAERGSPSVEGVVRLATGGVVEHAGRKTVVPYGWEPAQMEAAIAKVDGARIAAAAGGSELRVGDSKVTADELAKKMGSVALREAGPGRYRLQVGNQFVARADGRPFVLTLER